MLTLQNFVEKHKGDNKFIYTNLNKIYSLVNSFISSLTNNNEKNKDNNEEEEEKKQKIKKNENQINLLYELKIEELKNKIKELYQEIKYLTTYDENKKNNRKNFLLKNKISDLE
jgi:hypothetical protein